MASPEGMMKSVQLQDGKLSLLTKPIPKVLNPKHVRIQVTHTGVCGTDLSIIAGKFPAANPLVQGHEFSGRVHEIGPKVQTLVVGDRVCINPYDYCHGCCYCARGDPQFCVHDGMKTAFGYQRDGGFQEYCIVPAHLCTKLPDDMELQQSVFCQPLSTIIRGWDNMGHVSEDCKILIGGAGIIGLLWACMFHYHGYRDVTISEIFDSRKEMVNRMDLGFKPVHPKELSEQYARAQETGDERWGFDVIVDCTGNKMAVESEFLWLRKGATFVLFGVVGKGTKIEIEPFLIYQKEIKIVSSYLNKFCFDRCVRLVHDMSPRYLDFDKLEVKTFRLEDYEEALDTLKKGSISKAVFEY